MRAVRPQVLTRPWLGRLGLAHGLIGVGVYCLDRCDTDLRLLASLLERLGEARSSLAEPTVGRGRLSVELGMAHGLSGLVAFAALAAATDPGRYLLSEAAGSLLALVPPPDAPGVPVGWCSGELGAAAALTLASPFLNHPLVAQTLSGALRRVPFDPGGSGVETIGICHGTAGVAHVLHRISMATGQGQAWQATARWAGALLERLDDGERCRSSGLVEGTAGVVLVLLSLASDVTPGWDRMLLLS